MLLAASCSRENKTEKRIYFQSVSWQRFNILKFEFPLAEQEGRYDIVFELRCIKSFAYDGIPFNMVLNTPSGEERIKEYTLAFRDKNGAFAGTMAGDTSVVSMVLKRNLYCSKKGVLKVDIENLNPKMETEGVYSAGLILVSR